MQKNRARALMLGLRFSGRASGIRTHMGFTPTDFRTTMAFATFVIEVCGLDFPLALDFVFRPRPSSLYTFFLVPPLGLSVKV